MRPFCKGLPALRVPIAALTRHCGLEPECTRGVTCQQADNGYSTHLPNPPDAERLGKGIPPSDALESCEVEVEPRRTFGPDKARPRRVRKDSQLSSRNARDLE